MAHRQLRDFRLARPHGTDDEEYLTLPKIADYIDHHIDRDVYAEEMTGDICTICQEALTTPSPTSPPSTNDNASTAPPRTTNDEDDSPVRILPCHHLFHYPCILSWIRSIAPTRNTCPVCRVKLFRLNVLSPHQAARVREDEMRGFDRRWRPELYGRLLGYVDLRVRMELGGGDRHGNGCRSGHGEWDFTSIPRAARMFWETDDSEDASLGMGSSIISSENIVLGAQWIEMTAAGRVLDHLEEDGIALRAWAGQVFWGMYVMMVTTIREIDVGARAGEIRDRIRAANEAGERWVELSENGPRITIDVEGREGYGERIGTQLMEAMGWDVQGGEGGEEEAEVEGDEGDEGDEEDENVRARGEDRIELSLEELAEIFDTRGRDRGDGDGKALYGAAVQAWNEGGGSGSDAEDEDEHMEDQTHGGSQDDPDVSHPCATESPQRRSRLTTTTSSEPPTSTSTTARQPRCLLVRLPLPRHLRRPPLPTITNNEDQDAMDIDDDDDDTSHASGVSAIVSSGQDTSVQQPSPVANTSASTSDQRANTPQISPARPNVEPIDEFVPLGRGKRKREGSEDEVGTGR